MFTTGFTVMSQSTPDQLSLIDQGEGAPALVFLHYFSGAAASWQWVIDELQTEFRCLAIDLPGFGNAPPLAEPSLESYSQFIRNAITHLKLNRVVLIGHSMGGKLALQVAADMADSGLEQVILIAPSPATQEPMPEDERDRLLGDHHQPSTAETTVDSASQAILSEQQRATAIQTHIQAEDTAWRWWLLTGMNHSIAPLMAQIQIPVTVLASPNDPVIPFEVIRQDVVNLLPHSQLIKVPDVGHLMPLEVPKAIARLIRQGVKGDSEEL